jgi:CBS domain-containing membrane protein
MLVGIIAAMASRPSRALAHGGPAAAWLVAPLGATAVLVFALPPSPLAQPWAVVAGNTLSALVGVLCARWLHDPALGACVAVAVAMTLMLRLRCLLPPSAWARCTVARG